MKPAGGITNDELAPCRQARDHAQRPFEPREHGDLAVDHDHAPVFAARYKAGAVAHDRPRPAVMGDEQGPLVIPDDGGPLVTPNEGLVAEHDAARRREHHVAGVAGGRAQHGADVLGNARDAIAVDHRDHPGARAAPDPAIACFDERRDRARTEVVRARVRPHRRTVPSRPELATLPSRHTIARHA